MGETLLSVRPDLWSFRHTRVRLERLAQCAHPEEKRSDARGVGVSNPKFSTLVGER
jgi:hypothetical protein